MADGEAARERVREIVTEQLGLDVEFVQDDHRLIEDLSADSLDMVELTMAFEEEFGIEISDEQAEQCLTVEDIHRLIAELVP